MRSFSTLVLFASALLVASAVSADHAPSCGKLDDYRCDSTAKFSKCDTTGWVSFDCAAGTVCDISFFKKTGGSPCVHPSTVKDGGYKAEPKSYEEPKKSYEEPKKAYSEPPKTYVEPPKTYAEPAYTEPAKTYSAPAPSYNDYGKSHESKDRYTATSYDVYPKADKHESSKTGKDYEGGDDDKEEYDDGKEEYNDGKDYESGDSYDKEDKAYLQRRSYNYSPPAYTSYTAPKTSYGYSDTYNGYTPKNTYSSNNNYGYSSYSSYKPTRSYGGYGYLQRRSDSDDKADLERRSYGYNYNSHYTPKKSYGYSDSYNGYTPKNSYGGYGYLQRRSDSDDKADLERRSYGYNYNSHYTPKKSYGYSDNYNGYTPKNSYSSYSSYKPTNSYSGYGYLQRRSYSEYKPTSYSSYSTSYKPAYNNEYSHSYTPRNTYTHRQSNGYHY